MAVDFSTMATNQTGTTQKKQQQLPYLNENQQNQGILPVVQPTQQGVQQGNTQVLATAQNQALQQPQNTQTQQQTAEMTQKMMTDPNFGFNQQKYNTTALSGFDADRAAAMQKARQGVADVAGSGQVQENLIKTLMTQNVDRSQLENQLNLEGADREKQNWIDAINAGYAQSRAEQEAYTQGINNLLNVRGAYEPERSQAQGQQNAIDLAKIGQQNVLEQMAQQHGYNLAEMTEAQKSELIKMATQQGYNLQTLSEQQKNTLAQMAQAYGFDVNKMTLQQQQDLLKMSTQQGYNLQTLNEQQKNDLSKMAAAFGYDLATMSEEQKNQLAQMAVQQGYTVEQINLAQQNAIYMQNLGYNQDIQKMALQQGYDLTKMDKAFGQEITKLTTATNLDTASKTALMNLQAKIDVDQLTRSQDWQEVQNELDRQAEAAAQAGDADLQRELLTLRGEIDAKAQEAEMEFQNSQRIATQSWTTGERMDTQQFEKAMNYFDWAQKQAEQDRNVSLTRWVEEKRSQTELAMQVNDMAHDQKMAYLTTELASAEADKDVGRQQTILSYQANIQAAEDERNFGYETALTNLQGNIQKAIADGDNVAAAALQKSELEYRANRDTQEFALQRAAQELEAKGINLDIINTQYEQVLATYGEEAADEYMAQTLKSQGIDTSDWAIPDKQQAALQAMNEEYDLMQQQFLQTHPEYTVKTTEKQLVTDPTNGLRIWRDVPVDAISPEGMKSFNEYYNYTMYGELSPEMKEARRTAGFLGEDDLAFAQAGDKYKIENSVTASNGTVVPPGEYSVISETNSEGQKFWGQQRDVTKTYLVDKTGKRYQVNMTKSGTRGNIISGLWAEE